MQAYVNNKKTETEKALVFTAPYQKVTAADYVIITEDAPMTLKIRFDNEFNSVTIRPLRYGTDCRIIDKNTVEINLCENRNFSVEPDGRADNALLVFAGKSENIDRNKYDNIIYFEKGSHFADEIIIDRDNTLVYLEEGAVVNGKIRAEGINNIAVDGCGTLTMQNYTRSCGRDTSIDLKHCRNIDIRNILIKDSCNWHITLWGCDDAYVENVKLISWRGNADGIDVCGSRNVHVRGCFGRVWDDALVVKGVDTGDVENILFEDCVLWNDFARPMELGVSIRADKMHNVVFRNIDVIHSVTGYPIMGIHHGDRAEVCDIRFENINVESTPGAQLFDLRITDSVWNRDIKKGSIHDVYFKNINLIGDPGIEILPYHSRIQAFSSEHSIKNIFFENVRLLGKTARSAKELGLDVFGDVENVKITGDGEPYIDRVMTKILPGKFELCDDGMYRGTVAVEFENISDAKKIGSVSLRISPSRIYGRDIPLEFSVKPHASCTASAQIALPAGKYAFSLRGGDIDVLGSVGYLDLALVLGEDYDGCAEYSFGDSFGHHRGGMHFALRGDILMIKSELLKKYGLNIYAAKPVPTAVGQMLFSIEDTNTGEAPAVIAGADGTLLEGPQIGCPEEITYVFKNQPAVEKIGKTTVLKNLTGEAYVTFRQLGLEKDTDGFLLELEILDGSEKRYPFTMFASPIPNESAHMFVNVKRRG